MQVLGFGHTLKLNLWMCLHSTEVMEDLQKLLPGFPRITPQAPFLQVTPNMNFMHNILPMQSLQPTGQLEYKVLANCLFPVAASSSQWWGLDLVL